MIGIHAPCKDVATRRESRVWAASASYTEFPCTARKTAPVRGPPDLHNSFLGVGLLHRIC